MIRRPRRSGMGFKALALLAALILMSGPLAAETLTLNLKDASIRTLVETISEITGRNFIVDPRVKGKVTVVSSRPMDKDEIYQVFLSILQVHGFAAVETGEVVKILPDVTAKQSGTQGAVGGLRDEIVTRVIAVNNVSAPQLVPILRPLVPQQGHLAAYADTNVLVVSDRAANVSRLLRIVRRIDVKSGDEIELLRLEHASAAEMVRILTSLQQAAGSKKEGSNRLSMVADERTNSILVSGSESERLQIRGIVAHLDTPLETGGNAKVIYLKYAKAKDVAEVLKGISSGVVDDKAAKGAGNSKINIQADEASNALVISAPPDVLRSLKDVIVKLDVRRAQVLVEAVIADLSVSKTAELGAQVRFGSIGNNSTGLVGGSAFSNIGIAPNTSNIANPLGLANGLTLGVIDGTVNIGGTDVLNVPALVRALNSDANSNVLSTPSLLTLDNEEAKISVGQNVPFLTGQFSSTGANNGSANPFQTIERQDVGLTLTVKPQVNEGNAVKLEIENEVSSVSDTPASGTQGSGPTTNKRTISTSVLVEDGNIVVLGGLIDDQYTDSESKVPLLGDVPVLGELFKFKRTTKNKRNLMVFIRPSIVRDPTTGLALSSEKYNYIRALQLKEKEKGVSLMSSEEAPVMPKFNEYSLPPETDEE